MAPEGLASLKLKSRLLSCRAWTNNLVSFGGLPNLKDNFVTGSGTPFKVGVVSRRERSELLQRTSRGIRSTS